ncbi:MAG: hypothetical protein K2P14_04480 [Anaeroplasmataceae bacterium]|nr:hypothetical protein [Anaeroplasmataceae bacterium]
MYYNANDYELIYLIRDGNTQALKVLYDKYDHLIFKIYHEKYKYQGLVFLDFRQECFMVLHQSIYLFDSHYNSSFCNFYLLLVQRRIYKLYRKDSIRLKEKYTSYASYDYFEKDKNQEVILKLVLKELNDLTPMEEELLRECILKRGSIMELSRKYGVSYYDVYKKNKNLKEKIEKILTNALN